MSRRLRIILIAFLVTAPIVGWMGTRAGLSRDQMEEAFAARAEARKAGAPYYAPVAWEEVEREWTRLLEAWDEQRERPWLLRRFAALDSGATALTALARITSADALSVRDSLAVLTQETITRSRDTHAVLLRAAGTLPASFTNRPRLLSAAYALNRAELAVIQERFDIAAHDALAAEEVLDSLFFGVQHRLAVLRADRARDRAIADSLLDSGRMAIVVDKSSRRMQLAYGNGQIDSFRVELGPFRLRQKLREGDRTTPEGVFRVSRILKPGQSMYTAALVLNYPRAEDIARHRKAVVEGRISPDSGVGGRIEIHGSGARGGDWTDGCVAVTDEEMLRLVRQVPVGTPVFISSSLTDPIDWPWRSAQ